MNESKIEELETYYYAIRNITNSNCSIDFFISVIHGNKVVTKENKFKFIKFIEAG